MVIKSFEDVIPGPPEITQNATLVALKWCSKHKIDNDNLRIQKTGNAKVYENYWFAQWFADAKSSADRSRIAYKPCRLLRVLKMWIQVPPAFTKNNTLLL